MQGVLALVPAYKRPGTSCFRKRKEKKNANVIKSEILIFEGTKGLTSREVKINFTCH